MWMELLQVFRAGDPMEKLASDFQTMLLTVKDMGGLVEPHIFSMDLSLESSKKVYDLDVQVNKLERKIRKRMVAHVSLGRGNIPYCLLLMTLVKDVERIGDYLKNISEINRLGGGQIPESDLRTELEDLVALAMVLLNETSEILREQNRERAIELIQEGRAAGKRCDKLLVQLAKSDFNAAQTSSMVLLTRFFKRLGGHYVNILSSIVMPLHKVDFFDEKLLEEIQQDSDNTGGGAE